MNFMTHRQVGRKRHPLFLKKIQYQNQLMSLKEKGKRLVMCMKVESQEQKTMDTIFKNQRQQVGETDQSYSVTPRMKTP